MTALSSIKSITSMVLVLTILTGCVSQRTNYEHSSFNYRSVQSGGLAVIGMVDSKSRGKVYQYLDLSRQLETAVVSEREKYPLFSAKQTKKALGKNYAIVLDGYQHMNELGIAEYDHIRRAPIVARFGLFARIERSETERPEVYERLVKGADGKPIPNRVEEVLTSRRILTISAKVYDLKNGRLVWQKVREVSPKNENVYVKYDGKSFAGALTIATLNTVQNGTIKKKPPAYPDKAGAMSALLADLASKLPTLNPYPESRFSQ